MVYHSNHNHIIADKERIMSLNGQNVELFDRIAQLEREKMLREISEEGLTGKKKTARRHELGKPIWKVFFACTLTEHAKAMDGCEVKSALSYFYDRQKELQMYMKYPEMPFINNDCERQILEKVIGRKNFFFCQNHLTARRAAIIYTFFGTYKFQGKNPEEWLTY